MTNAAWAGQRTALAEHFRVLAPERRGHGHTPDVDGSLSYGVMADDTIAFIDTVVGAPCHLVGWSDGAVVGLLVALRRPDLVRKLVLIGGKADVSAYVPELEQATPLPADSPTYEPVRVAYEAVSPDGPHHWLAHRVRQDDGHVAKEPHIPLADLAAIRARTLILQGDDDVITLEHAVALYRAIPASELAVVPGTSHMAPIEKPDLVNYLLLDFLRRDATTTLLPARRAVIAAPQ